MARWKEWLKYDLYKKLWSLFTDRPFTYWTREAWKKFEVIWIVGLVSLGVWLGHNYDWKAILTGWLIFSLGFILGHIFWSTKKEEWDNGKTG